MSAGARAGVPPEQQNLLHLQLDESSTIAAHMAEVSPADPLAQTPSHHHSLMGSVRRWGGMVKFSHSVFALPFALIATFLAARQAYRSGAAARPWPSLAQVLLIVCCMVSARSAAMTFNRMVDAAIDARNPRTAG